MKILKGVRENSRSIITGRHVMSPNISGFWVRDSAFDPNSGSGVRLRPGIRGSVMRIQLLVSQRIHINMSFGLILLLGNKKATRSSCLIYVAGRFMQLQTNRSSYHHQKSTAAKTRKINAVDTIILT